MIENIIPGRYPQILIKHLIIVSLFVPYYISIQNNLYFPDYILSVLFALLIAVSMLRWQDFIPEKGKFVAFALIGTGILYDVFALYMNKRYLHWYSEQINVTISFAFFIILLLSQRTDTEIITDKVVRFLIHSIIISNLIGLFFYFRKYLSISFVNGRIQLTPMDPTYYETRFYWLYSHKSEYAFMLVAFIALFFVYRRLFKNIYTFCLSVALLFGCIIASHTYTSMVGALCIIAGFAVDLSVKYIKKINVKYLVAGIPFLLVAGVLGVKLAQERDLGTLGGRIYIWREGIHIVKENFHGIGTQFSMVSFPVPGLSFEVYNCHNLFLNQMLRYSVPVGFCFLIMFVIIIVASIMNRRNFLIIGIWLSLLIPMNMDYCLMTNSLPMLLLVLYCICFRRLEIPKNNMTDERQGRIE